jgi:hypothetical protein
MHSLPGFEPTIKLMTKYVKIFVTTCLLSASFVLPINCFHEFTPNHAAKNNRGQCYDHNFLRFLPIFGVKMATFSKTNAMIKFLEKLAVV